MTVQKFMHLFQNDYFLMELWGGATDTHVLQKVWQAIDVFHLSVRGSLACLGNTGGANRNCCLLFLAAGLLRVLVCSSVHEMSRQQCDMHHSQLHFANEFLSKQDFRDKLFYWTPGWENCSHSGTENHTVQNMNPFFREPSVHLPCSLFFFIS
jgi:hypothetical protein